MYIYICIYIYICNYMYMMVDSKTKSRFRNLSTGQFLEPAIKRPNLHRSRTCRRQQAWALQTTSCRGSYDSGLNFRGCGPKKIWLWVRVSAPGQVPEVAINLSHGDDSISPLRVTIHCVASKSCFLPHLWQKETKLSQKIFQIGSNVNRLSTARVWLELLEVQRSNKTIG